MVRKVMPGELRAAVLAGDAPLFHPNTGQELGAGEKVILSPAARAGLEVARFCRLCGRRMVVRVRPDGWSATCSRHGAVDSADLEW